MGKERHLNSSFVVFALSPVPVPDRGKQGLGWDCAPPVLQEVVLTKSGF